MGITKGIVMISFRKIGAWAISVCLTNGSVFGGNTGGI